MAGALGPTNRTGSLSPDVNDPAFRAVSFDDLVNAYFDQARGLVDGGVDILLVETVFDTLNSKAALFAIEKCFDVIGRRLPVMLSFTITGIQWPDTFRTTVEAYWNSVSHMSVEHRHQLRTRTKGDAPIHRGAGWNRSDLRQLLPQRRTAGPAFAYRVSRNAGDHDSSAQGVAVSGGSISLAAVAEPRRTTFDHSQMLSRGCAPRSLPAIEPYLRLSGLEAVTVRPESNFVNIGERTNVTGSPKFSKLILAGEYEPALAIARQQVENGAQLIDVNMDEGMLDSEQAMTHFLRLIGSEPDIARVPIVIDSSKWSILEAGLKCSQGKGIVNSITSGRRGEVCRTGAARPPVRRGCHRHGVRRTRTSRLL